MNDQTFWMVWREGSATPTRVHHSDSSAMNEAKRLARQHDGQTFYVLRATEKVVCQDIRVVQLCDIPF